MNVHIEIKGEGLLNELNGRLLVDFKDYTEKVAIEWVTNIAVKEIKKRALGPLFLF